MCSVTNRNLSFEEGSQSTTISSLSEKSKEETGISLQVNIIGPIIIFVIIFILHFVSLFCYRGHIDVI